MAGEKVYRFKNSEFYYTQDAKGQKTFYDKNKKPVSESIYLKAENAHINSAGQVVKNEQKFIIPGSKTGRYYKWINGKRHYYAANGTEIKETYFLKAENAYIDEKNSMRSKNAKAASAKVANNSIQKKSAQQIVDNLEKAIKGRNDLDKIKAELNKIDNPDEMAEVNRILASKGYKADDLYSPVEKFMYKELTHNPTRMYNSFDELEKYVSKWINNGTLKGQDANNAQARLAARIICDGGDGLGTNCKKIKKGIHLIKNPKATGSDVRDKANAKAVYVKVNQIISRHSTFYGIGKASNDLRDYLKGEMWEGEVKYLDGVLAQNNAIQSKQKTKAIKDLVREAVEGAGTDIEALKQALKGIDSKADRAAVNKELKAYIKEKDIKLQYPNQEPLQAIMYDELDNFAGIGTNHKEIRKFNEMLIKQGAYSKEEAVLIRGEQAALQAADGGYNNILDAVSQIKDPEVLKRMNVVLTNLKYKNLDDLMAKKNLSQTKQDLVNAELAANSLLPDEKAAQVATRLVLNNDFNVKAKGLAAIRNSKIATIVDKNLQKQGKSLAKIVEQFNKEKQNFKTKAKFWDGLAMIGGGFIAEHISDKYAKNTDSSDNLYLKSDKAVVKISQQQKAAYDAAINKLDSDYKQMKADYEDALDEQGAVSGAVDAFCAVYNIGTTRNDIEARIEHDKETIRLLKLASEGKLTKMVNGKSVPVKFEEVFKERQSAYVSGNGASISAIKHAASKKEVKFDQKAVNNVNNHAQKIIAMEVAKEYIVDGWAELDSAFNSQNTEVLTTAIVSNLDKLSKITGKKMSLEAFKLTVKNGKIVDIQGKPASGAILRGVIQKLKTAYSDVSKAIYGQSLALNASPKDVKNLVDNGYESKIDSFKNEYEKAYGQKPTDDMIKSYLSTINNGKMVVNIAAIIGASILTAGYGGLAIFAGVATTSLAMNGLENSTDANGWTNSEFADDATQALWDGALAACGVKIGKFAEKFATNASVILKNRELISKLPAAGNLSRHTLNRVAYWTTRVQAMGGELTSDAVQALMMQYCKDGEFNEQGFIMALVMSAGFNTAGHLAHGIGAKPKKGYLNDLKPDLPNIKNTKSTQTQSSAQAGSKSTSSTEGAHFYDKSAVKKQKEPVSKEFKKSIAEIRKGITDNKTIGELLETNPLLARFKDELEKVADYRITEILDSTNTLRGTHQASKKRIQLNLRALETNEEAFINTLLHEVEHAKQRIKYDHIKALGKDASREQKKYVQAYDKMMAADKARADFYAAHKDIIDKWAAKDDNAFKAIFTDRFTKDRKIISQYKTLLKKYKAASLEAEARKAGANAVKSYKKANKGDNNGQAGTGNEGLNGIQEGNATGNPTWVVGSDAQHNIPQGSNGHKRVKVRTINENDNTTATYVDYIDPNVGKVHSNVKTDAKGNKTITIYDTAQNKVAKEIKIKADKTRVETTYDLSNGAPIKEVETLADGTEIRKFGSKESHRWNKQIETKPDGKTIETEFSQTTGEAIKQVEKNPHGSRVEKEFADDNKLKRMVEYRPDKTKIETSYHNGKKIKEVITKPDGTVIKRDIAETSGRVTNEVKTEPQKPETGKTTVKTDKKGNTITTVKNDDGTKTITKTDANGNVLTVTQLSKRGRTVSVETINADGTKDIKIGNTVEHHADASNPKRVTSVNYGKDVEIEFKYDSDGNCTGTVVKNKNKNNQKYKVEADGKRFKFINEKGKEIFAEFDSKARSWIMKNSKGKKIGQFKPKFSHWKRNTILAAALAIAISAGAYNKIIPNEETKLNVETENDSEDKTKSTETNTETVSNATDSNDTDTEAASDDTDTNEATEGDDKSSTPSENTDNSETDEDPGVWTDTSLDAPNDNTQDESSVNSNLNENDTFTDSASGNVTGNETVSSTSSNTTNIEDNIPDTEEEISDLSDTTEVEVNVDTEVNIENDSETNTEDNRITISDLANGIDSNGNKREITAEERMRITEHIRNAKTEADIEAIQTEIRSFKRFMGRKNLRRAYKAKLNSLRHPDIESTAKNENEKYQRKYDKRMDKIENSKIYNKDLAELEKEHYYDA